MPLFEISAREVLEARSEENGTRAWPSREDGDNRVEPLAKPEFDVPFRLIPGEGIFTIGSCFARNVESKLLDHGFRIPALDIFKQAEFSRLESSALNNYGVPSIYQELAWALDPEFPFKPETSFIELLPGKFVDAHLPVEIRPAPLDIVSARREAVRRATAEARNCRVVIMTLGLTEVWYDKVNALYLNAHPRTKVLEAEPDRYALRVLSFEETVDYLRRIIDVLTRFGRADLQVIATVSPVPMRSTYRPVDVMVANTYSKSVLRTAVEHVVAAHSNVHYFPSYESIILSDRHRAYRYDLIHIEQELVDLNVGRMVSGFVGRSEHTDDMDPATLLDHIEETSRGNARLRWNLLRDNAHRVRGSLLFASAYIRAALNRKAYGPANAALRDSPDEWRGAERQLLEAEIMIGEERFAQAVTILQGLMIPKVAKLTGEGRRAYRLLVEAHIGLKDMDAAHAAAMIFARDDFKRNGRNRVFEILAKGYRDADRLTEAAHFYAKAIELAPSDTLVLDYVDVLLVLRRTEEARALLHSISSEAATVRRRKEHLQAFFVEAG